MQDKVMEIENQISIENHVQIAQNMIRKSKTSTDVLYFLVFPSVAKARLITINGADVSSYHDFIKTTKARLVALFAVFVDTTLSHVIATLHDTRYKKRVMIFDNLGGDTNHVRFLSTFIEKQMRSDIVFETTRTCPVQRINGMDCAYWTLAFFAYILDHPTGTIQGFQRRFSKKMYDDLFEHSDKFLKEEMKKFKKYIKKTLTKLNAIDKLFEQKLTL